MYQYGACALYIINYFATPILAVEKPKLSIYSGYGTIGRRPAADVGRRGEIWWGPSRTTAGIQPLL